MSDRDQLLSFGFAPALINKALKVTKNAGLQPAMDWMLANPDDPGEEEEAGKSIAAATQQEEEITDEQAAAIPNSLQCDECLKKFRNSVTAEFHATRSGHTNFSESTDIIKPLTEQEKIEKIAELKAKAAAKKAEEAKTSAKEFKASEQLRKMQTDETRALKEKMEQDKMLKDLAAKKREKLEEKKHLQQVRAQIEEDRKKKQLEVQAAKARASDALQEQQTAAQSFVPASTSETSRIQLRLPSGPPLVHTFPSTSPLSAVFDLLASERQIVSNCSLLVAYPRRVLTQADSTTTLTDLGLVPSAAITVTLS